MMSTQKKSRRKRVKSESVSTTVSTTSITEQETPQLSPEQVRLQQLMQGLINEATRLIIKVATCDCNHKDDCDVYRGAKQIAKLIDEILSLRRV